MTDPEFRAETRKLDIARKEKLRQKENRAEARKMAKEERERIEKEWRAICAAHEDAVKAWEAEVAQLQAAPGGCLKKNLPKKPKRVPKPKPKCAEEENDEGEEDPAGEEDATECRKEV